MSASATIANSQSPIANGWRTDAPPKDGTRIVAIGKVIYTEDACTTAESFLAELAWTEKPGEAKGWHRPNGMALCCYLDDEVVIHYWNLYPLEVAA